MTELLCIHPENPQVRLIKPVVALLKKGGVAVLPTDSGYSLCCVLGQKEAITRIRRIRGLDEKHYFTLLCRDFAEVSLYAEINNQAFRFLKAHTPAPITFILQATKEVPRKLLHSSRRTVGIRIPEGKIIMAVLLALAGPLMSVSVDIYEEDWPLLDPEEIFSHYGKQVDLMVDGGDMVNEHTTVVNLISGVPEVVRQGKYVIG